MLKQVVHVSTIVLQRLFAFYPLNQNHKTNGELVTDSVFGCVILIQYF
jgi:hypothetical protein